MSKNSNEEYDIHCHNPIFDPFIYLFIYDKKKKMMKTNIYNNDENK
jgi:hypothetical protein